MQRVVDEDVVPEDALHEQRLVLQLFDGVEQLEQDKHGFHAVQAQHCGAQTEALVNGERCVFRHDQEVAVALEYCQRWQDVIVKLTGWLVNGIGVQAYYGAAVDSIQQRSEDFFGRGRLLIGAGFVYRGPVGGRELLLSLLPQILVIGLRNVMEVLRIAQVVEIEPHFRTGRERQHLFGLHVHNLE